MKRWLFTPQRPKKKAYEQKKEAVELFFNETFPNLVLRANKEGAIIVFLDETGLNTCCHFGRSYSPIGVRPTVEVPSEKYSRNVVIPVTTEGKFFFHELRTKHEHPNLYPVFNRTPESP
jgi:hypothetical protein